jgi:hypothetical protein
MLPTNVAADASRALQAEPLPLSRWKLMPTAATITAASETAIAIVRLEGPLGFASPRCALAPSIFGDAAVDLGEPRLRLERATIFNRRYCSLQIVHFLGDGGARVHPARLPRTSSRLARAKVAANFACARSSARLTELGLVGDRSVRD